MHTCPIVSSHLQVAYKKVITLSSTHAVVKTQMDSIPNMNNSVLTIADLKPSHQITDILLVL